MASWQVVSIIVAMVIGVFVGAVIALKQNRARREAMQWQAQCNAYVLAAWENLRLDDAPVGHLVDRVWNRRVALCHYTWKQSLPPQAELAATLARVSDGVAALSDVYERDGQAHFDVALRVNEATKSYLADLDKIRYHNG